MLFTVISWGATALMAVTCVAAIFRGGAPERWTAAALALAWLGSLLAPFDFSSPPWAVIGIDAGLFLVLLYWAAFSKKSWPIWAAAFQFLILATHAAFARNIGLDQWGYVSAYYVWSIAVVVCLLIGVIRARRIGRDAQVA